MDEATASFPLLPELWFTIICFLPTFEDRFAAALTCKVWYAEYYKLTRKHNDLLACEHLALDLPHFPEKRAARKRRGPYVCLNFEQFLYSFYMHGRRVLYTFAVCEGGTELVVLQRRGAIMDAIFCLKVNVDSHLYQLHYKDAQEPRENVICRIAFYCPYDPETPCKDIFDHYDNMVAMGPNPMGIYNNARRSFNSKLARRVYYYPYYVQLREKHPLKNKQTQ